MLRHAYRRVDHRSLTWLNPRTAVEHLCRNPLWGAAGEGAHASQPPRSHLKVKPQAMTPRQVLSWLVIALLVVLLYLLLSQLVMVNV